jgi:hypothetical protein
MISIFGSKTKAQEILLLLDDAKDVVRQGFYENELEAVEKFCRENGIFLVKSNFRVELEGSEYSNRGLRVPADREGMFFVYLSKDELMANMAAYYEFKRDDRNLGLILGYPSCCVDFFCRNFSEKNANPVHKPTNPYTNLTKRNRDCVIISHFPCSSECRKSIELAKKYLNVISKHDAKRAEEMMNLLGSNINPQGRDVKRRKPESDISKIFF